MREIHVKRFFECLIPVTVCNLKCSYCYVIQRDYRNMKLAELKYTPEHIGKCLTKERLGGSASFQYVVQEKHLHSLKHSKLLRNF